jgi:hypothetical protein
MEPDPRSAQKMKVGPTGIRRRQKNMLERSEGFAD